MTPLKPLSRRSFISLGASATAGIALAHPAKPAPPLTLGFSLYGMKTLKTGEALTLPAIKPVAVHAVSLEAGEVFVTLAGSATSTEGPGA